MDIFTLLQAEYGKEPGPHTVDGFCVFARAWISKRAVSAGPVVLDGGASFPLVDISMRATPPTPQAASRPVEPPAVVSLVGGAARAGVSSLAGGMSPGADPMASPIPNADPFPRK